MRPANIVRALRHTPPDHGDGRARRWRMSTIFWAMQAHVQKGSYLRRITATMAVSPTSTPIWPMIGQPFPFNAAFAKMEAEPSLTNRRQMAISFAPSSVTSGLVQCRISVRQMLQWSPAALRPDRMHVGLTPDSCRASGHGDRSQRSKS
jgi:hypothetical protein